MICGIEIAQDKRTAGMSLVSPRTMALYTDNALCLKTIQQLRWVDGHYCPRCKSAAISKMKSNIFREAFRCADCGYLHNTLSGTLFMGAKLPLPSYFQFFTILNALGSSLPFRDIAFVVDVAHKTAKGFVTRLNEINADIPFTVIDRDLSDRYRAEYKEHSIGAAENFFAYCEIKSILVDEDEFLRYIQLISTTAVPESEE